MNVKSPILLLVVGAALAAGILAANFGASTSSPPGGVPQGSVSASAPASS